MDDLSAMAQSRCNPELSRDTGRPSSDGHVQVLVMNLPFRARWQDLKDLCRQACSVERADVALEVDGRSRGFGEVTCSSRADAEKLFQKFDHYEWQGRKLSVILMQSPDGRAMQSASGLNSPHPGLEDPSDTQNRQFASGLMQPLVLTDDRLVFVGNLPFSMQWQDLKDLLRPAGRVQRTEVSMSSDGRSRGWGTALFVSAEEALNAVAMFNNKEVEGRTVKVRLDKLGGRGLPRTYQPADSTTRQRSDASGPTRSTHQRPLAYHPHETPSTGPMSQFYYPSAAGPADLSNFVTPRNNARYDQMMQPQFPYYSNDRDSSTPSAAKPDRYPW